MKAALDIPNRDARRLWLAANGLSGAPAGPVDVPGMIAALGRVAGPGPVSRIRREPDDFIRGIVSGWPQTFNADAAKELGFVAEPDMDTIIRIHIEDELGGTFAE